MASYPRDPAIVLEAVLYFPPPFVELHGRFEPIADRLREIALCLDVTETPPTDPEAASSLPVGPHGLGAARRAHARACPCSDFRSLRQMKLEVGLEEGPDRRHGMSQRCISTEARKSPRRARPGADRGCDAACGAGPVA